MKVMERNWRCSRTGWRCIVAGRLPERLVLLDNQFAELPIFQGFVEMSLLVLEHIVEDRGQHLGLHADSTAMKKFAAPTE